MRGPLRELNDKKNSYKIYIQSGFIYEYIKIYNWTRFQQIC